MIKNVVHIASVSREEVKEELKTSISCGVMEEIGALLIPSPLFFFLCFKAIEICDHLAFILRYL